MPIGLAARPDAERIRRESSGPLRYGIPLLGSPRMPGVDDGKQHPTGKKEVRSAGQGQTGRIGSGYNLPVPAGEISEVEDHCRQRFRNDLADPLMTDLKQFHPAKDALPVQQFTRSIQGPLLDIEAPYPAGGTDQPCKQQGVVTVTAGCVCNPIAWAHLLLQQAM